MTHAVLRLNWRSLAQSLAVLIALIIAPAVSAQSVNDAGAQRANALARVVSSVLTEDAKFQPLDTLAAPGAGDKFGHSISVSGNRAIVGATHDDQPGKGNTGAAYVFEFRGGTWVLTAKLTAADAAADDFFGASVSLSGDRALIGAYGDGSGLLTNYIGAAYVFELSGDEWTQTAKLDAPDSDISSRFGISVSLSGDRALVGADIKGVAYVFELGAVTAGTWTETHQLMPSDAFPHVDAFGESVSLSGDIALVGAPDESTYDGPSGEEEYHGAAYLFDLSAPVACAGGGPETCETQRIIAPDFADSDYFGTSVSVSGNRVLIGAPYNRNEGIRTGSAYVFTFFGSTSALEQKLTASDAAGGDRFGSSVSLWGDTALIGATHDDSGASNGGEAYVFELGAVTPNVWSEMQTLQSAGLDANDQFGFSVSLGADHALVGAPFDGGGSKKGSANAFGRLGGVWTESADLTDTAVTKDDHFGTSVSLSGNRALVGARFYDHLRKVDAGAAYIVDGSWTQTAKLTASDAAGNDAFGWSVSVRGDRALIGAYGSGTGGAAYVFDLSGGSWMETVKLTASDAAASLDVFGISVSLSDDRALVGAGGDRHGGKADAGSAYVFDLSGGSWMETVKLTASDAGADDHFGWSVSLSEGRALIGAHGDDDTGSAYVFDFSGEGWAETAKLVASDAAAGDVFGITVSLSGDRALVGAYGDDESGEFTGAAYAFHLEGESWVETAKLTASDAAADDRFGDAVAISGDRALVGAPKDDDEARDSGAMYVFELVALPAFASLSGAEGYRMLALPSGGTFGDLLGPLWTEGFPGSDDPGSAYCSAYEWDEMAGTFADGFTCVPDQTAAFEQGAGVFAYVWEDDDRTTPTTVEGEFPKTIVFDPPPVAYPYSAFPLTYTPGPGSAVEWGWNLLGNPLRYAFDWDLAVRSGGLAPSVYVYDPNHFGGSYRFWVAGLGGDLPDGVVPALQGFFVQTVAPSPGLSIPEAAEVPDTTGVYGRGGGGPNPLRLELAVDTGGSLEPVSAAFVATAETAALGLDPLDAHTLTPTAWPRTVLSTFTVGDETPSALSLNALPSHAVGEITVLLEVAAEGHAAGALDLALSWSGALPDGWSATLVDRQSGVETPLVEGGSYRFAVDVPAAGKTHAARPLGLGLDMGIPASPSRAQARSVSGGALTTGDRLALVLTPPAREPTFTLALTPEDAPVVLGRRGGRVVFEISGANETGSALTQEVWLVVTDPNGQEVTRSFGSITIPPGGARTKTLRVRIRGASPPGTYTIATHAGTYPDGPLGSAQFTVRKEGEASAKTGSGGVSLEAESEWVIFEALLAFADEVRVAPNPARGAAQVSFVLAAEEDVRVAVYDALGREVAEIARGLHGPGRHVAEIPVGSLASGVYVLHLQTASAAQTARFTVVR